MSRKIRIYKRGSVSIFPMKKLSFKYSLYVYFCAPEVRTIYISTFSVFRLWMCNYESFHSLSIINSFCRHSMATNILIMKQSVANYDEGVQLYPHIFNSTLSDPFIFRERKNFEFWFSNLINFVYNFTNTTIIVFNFIWLLTLAMIVNARKIYFSMSVKCDRKKNSIKDKSIFIL